MQVVATDFISRTDSLPGIGSSPQFTEAVFNAAEKSPPDQVQVPQGFVIYELEAIKPPATPTFEEIRSRVETEFKNERAGTLLTQKTQELSDRAKAEHDLKKAAKELGATMKTSDFVLPDGQVPDIGSMSGAASVAFTLKPGDISGPVDSGNTGVVLAILDKQAPSGLGLRRQERSDPRYAGADQAIRIVRAVRGEPARANGKIREDQD